MRDEVVKVEILAVTIGEKVGNKAGVANEIVDEWLKRLKECHIDVVQGREPINKVMKLMLFANLSGEELDEVLDHLPDSEEYFCSFDNLTDWIVEFYMGKGEAYEKEVVVDKSPREGCTFRRGAIEVEVGFRYLYTYNTEDNIYEISEEEFDKMASECETEDEEYCDEA